MSPVNDAQDSPNWLKLPVELQHQYFELAAQEAERCKTRLFEIEKIKNDFAKILKFQEIPKDDSWKNWTISVVDGSFSPFLSERVGARYGVFNAGYMIFKGNSLKSEKHDSGMFSHSQTGSSIQTEKVLGLLATLLEREVAINCLDNMGVDLVLIDGSFFGFRAGCSAIRNRLIEVERFKTGGKLVDKIKQLSTKIMDSKRAVGVVKRVRTCAFQGWLAQKQSQPGIPIDAKITGTPEISDRAILEKLMPPQTWFAYEWLLKMPEAFNYYAAYKASLRQQVEAGYTRTAEDVMNMHIRRVNEAVLKDLGCSSDEIFRTSRYYLRSCDSAFPLCFEAHRDMNITPILVYFQANCNKATGLPFPIDLIDQNVSLPQGFTKEFVEEVEAVLIRDKKMKALAPSYYFTSINPQKEE